MKFIAKATSVDMVAVWEGYYAELKQGDEINSVIVGEDGNFHKVIPSTVKYYTGVMTEKAQPIYEGDKVQVWTNLDSATGVVKWSVYDIGWVIEDELGVYHDLLGDTRNFVR